VKKAEIHTAGPRPLDGGYFLVIKHNNNPIIQLATPIQNSFIANSSFPMINIIREAKIDKAPYIKRNRPITILHLLI
jgi:hypothetical protein